MSFVIEPISERAKRIYHQTFQRIQDFSDVFLDRRDVFASDLVSKNGCVIGPFEDGMNHIVVDLRIANFMKGSLAHRTLCAANKNRRVSPADVFSEVILHEAGHILFDEHLSGRIGYLARDRALFYLPPEAEESFAFCFGEYMSGLSLPLENILPYYSEDGMDPEKIARLYRSLRDLRFGNPKNILSPSVLLEWVESSRN